MDIEYILKSAEIIENTGNNKIKRFIDNEFDLIIKFYDDQSLLKHQRETYFYEFLNKKKIKSIPRLQYYSLKDRFSIFDYFENDNTQVVFDKSLLKTFANFINNINLSLVINDYKFRAIDSAFSLQEHFNNINTLIHKYKNLCNNNLYNYDYEFDLLNKYHKILLNYKILNKDLINTKKTELILSPSDFGAHNILKTTNGVYFIDFEFSGIDDPAKLICDFFLHPRNLFDHKLIDFFCDNLFFMNINILKRVKFLFPIYTIKWILIFINYIDQKNIKKKENLIQNFNFEKYRKNQLRKVNYYDVILSKYF